MNRMRFLRSLERQSCLKYVNILELDDGYRSAGLLHSCLGRLGSGVDGESELLLYLATAEELHGALARHDALPCEGSDVVRTSVQLLLENIQVEWLHFYAAWVNESTELWLTADERSLTTFETEAATLTSTRLLTLGTTTSGRTDTGTITTSDANATLSGTSVWLERVQHGMTGRMETAGTKMAWRFGSRNCTEAEPKATEEIARGQGENGW